MSPQKTPPSRRCNALGIGALLLVLLSSLQIGFASQLGINGAKVHYAASFSGCSRNPLTVTNTTTGTTATQATISGLDATACNGKTVQLWLGSGSTTVTTATAGTVTGTSVTLTLPTFTTAAIVKALVYVGGWPVPTTWTYTPPASLPLASCAAISGGGTCSVVEVSGTSWANNWLKTFQVSTTSTSEVPWQVTINLSDPSLPFIASDLQDKQGGLVLVSAASCSTSPRTVVVKGTTNWHPYDTVTSGRVIQFQVQGSTSGAGNLINC